MKNVKLPLFVLAIICFVISCDEKTPEITNEQEVITTVTYTLVPTGGGSNVVLTFRDTDGDGGNAPTISEGTLKANTTYTGTLTLLNEQASPTEDITEEIAEEDEAHQFFFQSTVANLTLAYKDKDENNHPIGLSTTLTTKEAGSGTLVITLRHQPNKSAEGVSNGQIANAGGETDIEVTFSISVQ